MFSDKSEQLDYDKTIPGNTRERLAELQNARTIPYFLRDRKRERVATSATFPKSVPVQSQSRDPSVTIRASSNNNASRKRIDLKMMSGPLRGKAY